jgi:hypothetical protein
MKAHQIAARYTSAALLVALAACGDKSKRTAATDSDLARDLALAGSQPVNPTFQDTAVAPAPTQAGRAQEAPASARTRANLPPLSKRPAPVTQSPAPEPAPTTVAQTPAVAPAPAPGPARGQISGGTGVGITSGSKVCTSSNLPGDKIVATVNSAVSGSNGAVIPAGSSVVLEVASANPGQNGDGAQITFRVRAIVIGDKTYDVVADVAPEATLVKTKVGNADPNADRTKVVGGAIAGAILGRMIGHSTKGTVIGAATGAAAGAAAAKASERWEACLPAGTPMRLTLNQALVM